MSTTVYFEMKLKNTLTNNIVIIEMSISTFVTDFTYISKLNVSFSREITCMLLIYTQAYRWINTIIVWHVCNKSHKYTLED